MDVITEGDSQFGSMTWFIGVVEDVNDPLKINRVRVRCIGYHTDDKAAMKVGDLPWAPFLSSTAQMSAPMVNQGDWVVGFFIDGMQAQQPVVIGSFTSIPKDKANVEKGFNDPSGIHPKPEQLEDDPLGGGTNSRHARGLEGEVDKNAIAYSKSSVTTNIATAEGSSFAEPVTKFAAVYPANHVMETDGGHVFELDDTPGAERVHIFHKKGSFVEFHPDGSIVHRGAQDRYHIVLKDENLYVGGTLNMSVSGTVNILAGNNTNISTVGDATWKVGGNLRLDVAKNFDVAVGGAVNIDSSGKMQLDSQGSFAIASGGSIGIDAASSATVYAGGQCGIRGSKVQLDGSTILAKPKIDIGGGPVSKPSSGPTIIIPKAPIPISVTGPAARKGFTINGVFVENSPSIDLDDASTSYNIQRSQEYIENPDKFRNPTAAADGVKENYPGTPESGGTGESLIIDTPPASDLCAFINDQLKLAAGGHWSETGMGGARSNPNIVRIWETLGIDGKGSAYWKSDQTPWCMGFVNYCLKMSGYRFVQTARAFDIRDRQSAYKAISVPVSQAKCGDIALWSYSHVNFVLGSSGGRLSFVGGNQSPKGKATNNNPSQGDVTRNSPGLGSLIGIYRPVKK